MNLAERMAKAYYEASDWEGAPQPELSWEAYKEQYPEIAASDIRCMNAAIAELRKPTDAMMRAGASYDEDLGTYDIFTSMIDAGLEEGKETKDAL